MSMSEAGRLGAISKANGIRKRYVSNPRKC